MKCATGTCKGDESECIGYLPGPLQHALYVASAGIAIVLQVLPRGFQKPGLR